MLCLCDAATPLCARHGGPSQDARGNARSLGEVQSRGRWACMKSVARYRKSGGYEKQIALMSEAQIVEARILQKSYPPGRYAHPKLTSGARAWQWVWDGS